MPDNESSESRDSVLILKASCSDISRFDTTGRLKDLEKKAQEPAKNTAENPVKKFLAATIGIFFLMIGLIGLFGNDQVLISGLCIFFGILIIWTFIARPEMQKRKESPAQKNAGATEVSMIFNKHCIIMSSPYNELKKDWSELVQYKKTKKGIHFNFSDEIEAWLPLTSFYGDELKTLTSLLQYKKN
ncbi:MAG: hypothetical protein H6Q52_3631 [Deltaproteobacteria bacterium]|nr:hypothetical protein [Deltaproteobacteria bacterium]